MGRNFGYSRGAKYKTKKGKQEPRRFANAPKPKWDPHRYISDEKFQGNMNTLVHEYARLKCTAKTNHGSVFAKRKRIRKDDIMDRYDYFCEEAPREGKYTPIIYS